MSHRIVPKPGLGSVEAAHRDHPVGRGKAPILVASVAVSLLLVATYTLQVSHTRSRGAWERLLAVWEQEIPAWIETLHASRRTRMRSYAALNAERRAFWDDRWTANAVEHRGETLETTLLGWKRRRVSEWSLRIPIPNDITWKGTPLRSTLYLIQEHSGLASQARALLAPANPHPSPDLLTYLGRFLESQGVLLEVDQPVGGCLDYWQRDSSARWRPHFEEVFEELGITVPPLPETTPWQGVFAGGISVSY